MGEVVFGPVIDISELTHDPHDPLEIVKRVVRRNLKRYPGITRSMLSSHVSPYGQKHGLPWAEVLDLMIEEGEVVQIPVISTGAPRRATLNYYLTADAPTKAS